MCIDLEFVPLDGFGVSFQKLLRCFEMLIWPWWRWKQVCLSLPSVPGKVKNFMIQTGDFQFNNGDGWRPGRLTAWLLELGHFRFAFHRSSVTLGRGLVVVCTTISQGGESIYGGTFNDEDFVRRHTQAKLFCSARNSSGKTASPSNGFGFVSRFTTSVPALSQHRPQAGVVSMANKGTSERRHHFFFGRFDHTRSESRKNNGTWGKGGLPRQSHPSQSSKCINHFHFWGPIQIITSEAGSQAETAMDRNSSSLWSGAPRCLVTACHSRLGRPRKFSPQNTFTVVHLYEFPFQRMGTAISAVRVSALGWIATGGSF